jgi:hypothetical protein
MDTALQLLIAGPRGIDVYRVKRMDAGEYCRLGWRLTKLDEEGAVHTVLVPKELPVYAATCDCQAATFRAPETCKHILALRKEGLLAKPPKAPKAPTGLALRLTKPRTRAS